MQRYALTLALLGCLSPLSSGFSLSTVRVPAPRAAAAQRAAAPRAAAAMLLGLNEKPTVLSPPKTIGEAKNLFQASYGKPVGMMLQSFVTELLASCQVAMVSPSFAYSRVFALGFDTLCSTFLEATPSESEKAALKESLCIGLNLDSKRIAADASELKAATKGQSEEDIFASDEFKAIAAVDNFKYSYPFGAGVLEMMRVAEVSIDEASIDR